MSDERDFNRLARAWLEFGPDEAPDRVIAAVLQAAEVTPQVRRPLRWPIWRSFRMTRLPLAATVVAALVVVVGGAILFTMGQDRNVIGGPAVSPSPSAAASTASAVGGAVPVELRYMWIGPQRTAPIELALHDRDRFDLTATSLTFPDDDLRNPLFVSVASMPAPGVLQFVASDTTAGCKVGDTGRYEWSLTPGGVGMTITAEGDACQPRSIALTGQWTRVACKDAADGCFGDLEAGTFSSQYIDPRVIPGGSWRPNFGALTYAVPAGWSNGSDWPVTFDLTPASDYALETPSGPPIDTFHGIYVFARPTATIQDATCANHEQTTVKRTVAGLIDWVRSRPSLVTTAPTPITIGGYSGQWIDIKRAPSWSKTCPDPSRPASSLPPTAIYLSESANDAEGWNMAVQGDEQMRLILLDLGDGSVVAIAIDSTYPDRYQDLVTQAMPIVASFKFK